MDLPFWGPSLQNAIDVFSGANPPGGQGPVGAFEVSAASVTIAAIAVTTAPALVNPAGSGKLIRIMRVLIADVSGTLIRSNFRYYRAKLASSVLTGLTDSSANIQPRTNVSSVANWLTGLTCTPAAPNFMPVGFGSGGAIAAQFYWLQDQPEGMIVVRPGEIWFPYVSNAAMAMVGDVGLAWIEHPLSLNN